MDIEEYRIRLKALRRKSEKEIRCLEIEFSKLNNPYKVGDIIEDHCNIILIDKIIFAYYERLNYIPSCLYYGVLLRKSDLKPYKNNKRGSIYQGNVIRELKYKN
jgi:hypothetical protein